MKKMVAVCCAILLGALNLYADFGNLQARFSKGKTYITFSEDTGSNHTYNLYRSASPITNVSAMTPKVNIPDNSAYDGTNRLYHVVADSALPLTLATGVFVYTPKDTSTAYYAVTVVRNGVENKSITPGINAITTGVNEAFWPLPLGVIREVKPQGSWREYYYEYYMDYFTWPDTQAYIALFGGLNRGYESYAEYYTVYAPSTATRLPVMVTLHMLSSSGMGLPYGAYVPNVLNLHFRDGNNTFWRFCTKDRVVACLKALLHDPTFAAVIDTERVVLRGGSMGACGTYEISFYEPTLFSVCNPQWGALLDMGGQSSDRYEYGHFSAFEATPSADRPPMLDFFGTWDGMAWGIYAHRKLINSYEKIHQGIWAKWENASHGGTTSGVLDDQVPGSVLRFKRNELFPAFAHSTLDDKYGAVDSSDFVSEGRVNSWFDWSSSLHDLGLPGDDIVDNTDTVAITFQALKPGAVVDITPRRLQGFKPAAGRTYCWRNQDIATGAFVDGGFIVADTARLVTAPNFGISQTGSRLLITGNDAAGFVKILVVDSAKGAPLKDARITLSTTPVSTRVTDAAGAAYVLSSTGSLTLDVSCPTFSAKTAIPVTVVQNDTTGITVRLSQLEVTGLVFVPDTFTLGQYFTYEPGIFTRHSDNALFPAPEGVVWAPTPAGNVSIDGHYAVTGITPGNVDVAASFQSFADTLHLNIVDTAAQPDSVILTYSSKVIDANAPYRLHAACIYKKVTKHTAYYTANIDAIAGWSTSDASVATVVNGVVTGHETGSVIIVAQAGTKSDTCVITVRPTPSFVFRINFQAPQNPILETVWFATGWNRSNVWCGGYCSGDVMYSDSNGWGWFSGNSFTPRSDRGGNNFLLKSFVAVGVPSVFRINAPDGKYVTRIAMGDNIYGNTRSWAAFGADTIMTQELSDTIIGGTTYQWAKYNKIEDDTINVTGGAGIRITFKGIINYLVVISAAGIPMSLVADDDGVPDDPPDTLITAVDAVIKPVTAVALLAFPNPFNPSVNIAYSLPARISGVYRIYNTSGQCVFSQALAANAGGVRGKMGWNGTNRSGAMAASGLYVGKLRTSNGKTVVHKLLLLK